MLVLVVLSAYSQIPVNKTVPLGLGPTVEGTFQSSPYAVDKHNEIFNCIVISLQHSERYGII